MSPLLVCFFNCLFLVSLLFPQSTTEHNSNPTGLIRTVGQAIYNTFTGGGSRPDGTTTTPTTSSPASHVTEWASTNATATPVLSTTDLRRPSLTSHCRTPGCEFFGHSGTDYFCSKCSSEREKHRRNFTAPAAIIPYDGAERGVERPSDRSLSQGNYTGPLPLPVHRGETSAIQEAGATMSTVPTPGLDLRTRLCSEPGCGYCGSDEYGGRCHRCFMEMTKMDTGRGDFFAGGDHLPSAARFGAFDGSGASTLPGLTQRPHYPLGQSQSVTYGSQAVPCRNSGCQRYGLAENGGFCGTCQRAHVYT